MAMLEWLAMLNDFLSKPTARILMFCFFLLVDICVISGSLTEPFVCIRAWVRRS